MDNSKSAPMNPRQGFTKSLRKRWPVIALAGILAIAGAAAMVAAQGAFGGMMGASSLSKTQFDALTTADKVEVVFEITSMPSDKLLVGNFLDPVSNGIYRRTAAADALTVSIGTDTKIVMGQPADVHPGAIIQVQGKRTDNHSITAQQIVILTGYVTVQ